MDKGDFTLGCITACIIIVVSKILAYIIFPQEITHDYSKTIIADSSDKIELCISNAIHDITSRDFIFTQLTIKEMDTKKFIIKASGKEKGNLLNL